MPVWPERKPRLMVADPRKYRVRPPCEDWLLVWFRQRLRLLLHRRDCLHFLEERRPLWRMRRLEPRPTPPLRKPWPFRRYH